MTERPPVQAVIEALNQSVVIPNHQLLEERKTLLDILSVMGADDDYVYAVGATPNGYLGILLGVAMAQAEGR